jgi:lysophospholipase L1-like esterase
VPRVALARIVVSAVLGVALLSACGTSDPDHPSSGGSGGDPAAGSAAGTSAAGGSAAGTSATGGSAAGSSTVGGTSTTRTTRTTVTHVAAKPLPPATHTSCHSVVYVGDSTSDGEAEAAYVPLARLRAPAQLAKVGVKTTHMEVSGARSIVETYEGIPNGATVAQQLVSGGYRGCWILALGTNDAADVAAGSEVGLKTRISRMMSIIGKQHVMWVNVLTLGNAPQYYGNAGMQEWNRDLLAACHTYPQMRVFDWAAHAKPQWFIPDGVHYTTAGYEARTRLIAHALVKAFPRSEPPSASCLVH